MFLNVVLWLLMALMALSFLRGVMGPTLWDRLLVMNLMTVKGMLIVIVYATVNDNLAIIDVALIYALFSFIATIFLALFLLDHKRRGEEK